MRGARAAHCPPPLGAARRASHGSLLIILARPPRRPRRTPRRTQRDELDTTCRTAPHHATSLGRLPPAGPRFLLCPRRCDYAASLAAFNALMTHLFDLMVSNFCLNYFQQRTFQQRTFNLNFYIYF